MDVLSIKRQKNFDNEKMIIKAKAGCGKSKDAVFINNIPMVRRLCKKWIDRGSLEKIEDLMSVGCLGLTIAYNTYDPSKGFKFTTYLGKVVWMEFIKIARHNDMMCRKKYTKVSIDDCSDDGYHVFHEAIPSNSNDFDLVLDVCMNEMLIEAIEEKLSVREKFVTRMALFEGLSFEEIGRQMGVSKQCAHQIYKRSLNKIGKDQRVLRW